MQTSLTQLSNKLQYQHISVGTLAKHILTSCRFSAHISRCRHYLKTMTWWPRKHWLAYLPNGVLTDEERFAAVVVTQNMSWLPLLQALVDFVNGFTSVKDL